MCGIIGAFSFEVREKNIEHYVRWGAGQMHRRGPDAEGYSEMGQATFGFRRLAIRDLGTAANQPMKDSTGRYLLVFNGELYQTESLKSKLSSNTIYKTHSDTEVLLHCLVQLGVERTLLLLDGMFAFAWYDLTSNTLTLARDRCGIKPLYYAINNRLMLFCSEYDLLLCHDDFCNNPLNPDALAHYLRLGFVPDGEAIYQQTHLLPHGHFFKVTGDGRYELKSYSDYAWQVDLSSSGPLQGIVADSVQNQLVADVPVGVFQSGGIDSSLVSAAALQANSEIEGFTVGVESAGEMDESHVARTYAQAIAMRHHVRTISSTDALTTLIDQNTQAFSEPFADYSSLPTLLLSQFARERIKVALSGDGGDELFWGYPRNRQASIYMPLLAQKKAIRGMQILLKRIKQNEELIPFDLLNYSDFKDFSFQKTFITGAKGWAHRIFPYYGRSPFFLAKLSKELETIQTKSDVEWMNVLRKIEFDFHLQRVLLKVDRTSSYHSLEVRVPLLSNTMLQSSYSYIYTDCIQSNQGKVPLRNLLANNAKYSTISRLPKKGFTVPIDSWINGLLKKRITDRLQEVPNSLSSYLERKEILNLLSSCKNDKNGWLVWTIFTLFEWEEKRLINLKADYQSYKLCHQ